MREGFYFEAILIAYAMMEDRLRSFLYHIGLLNTRQSYKADVDKVKKSLRPIIQKYKKPDENDYFNITSISGKRKIVRCILQYAEEESNDCSDKYLIALRTQIDKYVDCESLMQTLEEIEQWCAYRNEIIHALMNKNLDSVYKELEDQAEKGMRLCRELDNQVDRIKTGNWIRRKSKLQNR